MILTLILNPHTFSLHPLLLHQRFLLYPISLARPLDKTTMKRTRSPVPQREISLASVEPLNLDELASSLDLPQHTRTSVLSLIDTWDDSTPPCPSPPPRAPAPPKQQPSSPQNAAPMLWKNLCKLWDDLFSSNPFSAVTLDRSNKQHPSQREEEKQPQLESERMESQCGEEARQQVGQRTHRGTDMSLDEACAQVSEFFDMDLDERDVQLITDDELPDVQESMSCESRQQRDVRLGVWKKDGEEQAVGSMTMPVARRLDFRHVAEPAQRRCITRDAVVDRRLGYRQMVRCRLKGGVDDGGRRVGDVENEREMRRRRMMEEQRRLSRNLRLARVGDVPRNIKLPAFNRGGRRQEGRVHVRRVVKVSGIESPTDIAKWR